MNSLSPILNQNYIKKDNTSQVYLITYINRDSIRLKTGVYVNGKHWDKNRRMVKRSDPDHEDKNLHINNCMARATEIFKKYRLNFKQLTPPILREEYRIFSTQIDFYKFFQNEINKKKQINEPSTMRRHQGVLEKLRRFRPTLRFSEIDEEFIKSFNGYMRVKLRNGKNTRAKTLSTLKEYLHIALRVGVIEYDPFKYYKIQTEKTEIICLTKNELEKLKRVYENNDYQPGKFKALRRFLFCCFTGLRISDLEQLSLHHIHNSIIQIVPHKTRNQKSIKIEIPIIEYAQRLIDDERADYKRVHVFEPMHRNTISRYIKEIAKDINLHKNISTKTARHTFATLFLETGGAIEVLQQLLGHSNIRETMVYVHVAKKRIIDQMTLFSNNI